MPDITLVEIAERLERECGERFAPPTIHRVFRRHGWSFSKSPPTARHWDAIGPRPMPSGQDRLDVAALYEAWFEAQQDLDPQRLIFIDETGLNTKIARLRRRTPWGERLRAGVPNGHWRTAPDNAQGLLRI
ncbi:MAG: hypothetical protein AAGA32_17180 [Pseudomonadota bacterium]